MPPISNVSNRTSFVSGTCPVCGSRLVHPRDKQESGQGFWQLTMTCPECFAWQRVRLNRAALLALEARICGDMHRMASDLEELERRDMVHECEKFITALWSGNIQPIDF
jgi:hypothetical protein